MEIKQSSRNASKVNSGEGSVSSETRGILNNSQKVGYEDYGGKKLTSFSR